MCPKTTPAGRIKILNAAALPERGRAMFAGTTVHQTDNNATRAYRKQIAYRLLSAEKRKERVNDLKAWVNSGRPLKRTRVPAGLGPGPLANFLRGNAPPTRSCPTGAPQLCTSNNIRR